MRFGRVTFSARAIALAVESGGRRPSHSPAEVGSSLPYGRVGTRRALRLRKSPRGGTEMQRSYAAGFAALGLAVALGISACGVSQQQEVELGMQESAQIQQQLPLVRDAVINQYVQSLGNQIASHTSR